MAALDKAIGLLPRSSQPEVELECFFYLYAHGAAPERVGALRKVKELIRQGIRSMDWDLSRNVARAIEKGHPEGHWLAKLAAVINDKAQPYILIDWPAWPNE